MTDVVRPGRLGDAPACSKIKNDWVDRTGWMPRVHAREEVERHYHAFVFQEREIYVIGDPPVAFVALGEDNFVTSLFCGPPGEGRGKVLLDHAKTKRPELQLWSFVANTGACRFYEREGFVETDRSDGDNEENLPDILYRWTAG
ncbi:MAG: GNAT family N-acetyltransferase [Pseudomonadota bacterium]